MSFTRHNWSNKTQKQPRSFQEQRSAWCFIDWKPEMLKVLCHCLETLLATLSSYISFLYYFFFHSFFPCIFNRYFPMKDVHKKMTLFFFFFPSTETSILNKPSTQHTMLLHEPGNFQLIWNLPLCFYSHKLPPVWQNQHWSQNLCTQYQVYHLEQIGGANLLVLSGSGNCELSVSCWSAPSTVLEHNSKWNILLLRFGDGIISF